ncbi:protein kinase [Streptosporangium sp. KLBMP 9127]|nr:protein kinase [Streptosporangium sp. KLBMP 9127]
MPEPHTRLLADRYELITPIGRGTMGTVWRAHDRSLGREVAVKEIRQEPGLGEEQRAELRARMIREGRTAARINHPSVAVVYDAIEDSGRPWIIMELVDARSLEQVIDEEGPLPARLVAEIGSDLLGALRAAHSQGILHRDVKPGNVLLTETGRVVLTDFGIAKAVGDANLTKTGMVIGSPGYTAPERARGDHTGPESDLWSLGATLYFAVEGRPAYERSSVAETLAALMTESADAPTQAGPLRPVLEALLEKDHTVRLSPSKAAAMLRAVADTPSSEPVEIPEDEPEPRPAPGRVQRPALGPGQSQRPAQRPGPGPAPRPAGQEFDPNKTIAVRRPKATPAPKRPPITPSGTASPDGQPTSGPRGGVPGAAIPPGSSVPGSAGPRDRTGPPAGPGAPRPPVPPARRPSGPPLQPGQRPPGSPPPSSAAPNQYGQQAPRHPASGLPMGGWQPGTGPQQGPPTPYGTQPNPAVAGPPASSYPGIPVAGVPGSGPPGPVPPAPPGNSSKGLGTDLFAIAGPSRPEPAQRGNRAGIFALVCLAVLAIAVIIILVTSTFSG